MQLHLAGMETGAGRSKTWPTCPSWQVTWSLVRIVENILLLGEYTPPVPLPSLGFGTRQPSPES